MEFFGRDTTDFPQSKYVAVTFSIMVLRVPERWVTPKLPLSLEPSRPSSGEPGASLRCCSTGLVP